MLSQEDYYFVCSKTHVVSIDIILEYDNKYLLGKRINEPAKGYYFVPGGSVSKNETLFDAMKRISKKELGIELNLSDFEFVMPSQHWYNCNFLDNSFGTHYLSLSYKKILSDEEFKNLDLRDQHSDFIFLTKEELLNDARVHDNNKIMFK